MTESESVALPLGDAPIILRCSLPRPEYPHKTGDRDTQAETDDRNARLNSMLKYYIKQNTKKQAF